MIAHFDAVGRCQKPTAHCGGIKNGEVFMATVTATKITLVRTGQKSILANPFTGGDDATLKEGFRQWLWLLCRGMATLDAVILIAEEHQLDFNKKWVGPTREKILDRLDELAVKIQSGKEFQFGEEIHSEIIYSYLQWCMAGKPLKSSV
jgi:hypothetical protein